MADKDDLIDDDAAGLPDGEDDLTATLRDEMGKMSGDGGDDDDDGGFDAPLDEGSIESRQTVEEEEGVKRVQDARDKASAPDAAAKKADAKKEAPSETDAKPDAKAGQKGEAKEGAETKPDEADKSGDKTPDAAEPISDDAYAEAIGGLPEPVQKRIEAERAESEAIMAPFKGREKDLEALGVEPKDAVEWFMNVNDYAQRDPAGYAAWVVGQATGGDPNKMEEVLKGAAAKLGYKVEKDTGPAAEDDDDPFMTDREKELLEENRKLKAAQVPQHEFGPDSPQEQSRRAVMDVISEVDAEGNPLRPDFEKLTPTILAIVKEQVRVSGRPMTGDDLRKAYEQAELAHPDTREAATARLLAAKSAAQPAPDVTQQGQKAAEAAEKAKAASTKIIDGPGQGAAHQPAKQDANMGLEDFLRMQMSGGS